MAQKILSISGLRGVIGDGLDPEFLTRFAAAFGEYAGRGPIVLARDGRSSGEMVKHAVVGGLLAAGCDVLDLGIATTPTCGVMVQELKAAGGIQLTASHNPIEWNGVKPFSAAGSVLNESEGKAFLTVLDRGPAYVPWSKVGQIRPVMDSGERHRDRVFRLVDVEAIRKARFRVVLDCNHGSGGVYSPQMLRDLGCEVIVLGGTPDGQFEHIPEPLEQNLKGLCDAVRDHQAAVGFAQDPDADRLAIVDNTGRYIGEELTLALCADHVLAKRPSPIVVNGSTSRVVADIAARHNCPFHRSFVGEAHVVAKMKEVGSLLGGEGNGGVIESAVGYVRDSLVSMAYVLDGLAKRQAALSTWVDSLPQYSIVKDKVPCPRDRVVAACKALRTAFQDATGTEGDGLRLDWPDRWVQVRASNTEPIIRVIAEAPDLAAARALTDKAMKLVRDVAG